MENTLSFDEVIKLGLNHVEKWTLSCPLTKDFKEKDRTYQGRIGCDKETYIKLYVTHPKKEGGRKLFYELEVLQDKTFLGEYRSTDSIDAGNRLPSLACSIDHKLLKEEAEPLRKLLNEEGL